MPTSTFDRKITITDPRGLEILQKMEDEDITSPQSSEEYLHERRKRCERYWKAMVRADELLLRCKLRSG